MLRLGLRVRSVEWRAPQLWRSSGVSAGKWGHSVGQWEGSEEGARRWGATVKSGPAAGGAPPKTKRKFGLTAKDKKRQRVKDVKRKRALVKDLRERKREEQFMAAIESAAVDPHSHSDSHSVSDSHSHSHSRSRSHSHSLPPSLSPEETEEFLEFADEETQMETEGETEESFEAQRKAELEQERIAAERLHADLRAQYPDMETVDDEEIDASAAVNQEEIDRLSAELEEEYRIAEQELEAEEAKVGQVAPLFYPHELIEKLKGVEDVMELIDVDLGFSPEEYRQMIEEENAEDIVVIDISKKCNFAKSIIIATTHSTRHRLAIAEKIRLQIQKRKQLLMPHMLEEGRCLLEGRLQPLPPEQSRDWISVDADSVLINLFSPDRREYYDLETFWTKEAEELPTDEEHIRDIMENHDVPDRQKASKAGARSRAGKKKKKRKAGKN